MKFNTALSFFFCGSVQLLSGFLPPAEGDPLQTDPAVRVCAAAGGAVTLPCGASSAVRPSRVSAVEWTRVDLVPPLTVHVLRDGEPLQKEQAEQFAGRTEVLRDGALRLSSVWRTDSGSYRCVLLRGRGLSLQDESFVSLLVVQVSGVSLSVTRTRSGRLQLVCRSSGWSLPPRVSLLDSSGSLLPAECRTALRPDRLHAVSALLDAAAVTGNGTLTCRVGIPGTNLSYENHVHISDELDPADPQCLGCLFVSLAAVLLLCVAVAGVLLVFPLSSIEKLRAIVRRLAGLGFRFVTQDAEKRLGSECADISGVQTSGASEDTARANESLCRGARGVAASNQLAASDLQQLLRFRETISSVGHSLGVPPALLAAIISRQSRAGAILSADGFGDVDRNCFGLMQINRHYHAVKGAPLSREHVDQGATFLIQLLKTMRRTKPDWNPEQQLKGALACYVAGEDRVIPLSYEQLDSVTPHGDFANDVIARAQWLANNGF